jgi:dTDP-4-dehydrorhamnose 3,5-epimerase-like enzyme|tara:strand:+ start:2849 stop:3280 length:432 start_codon:yes stop_codon:yes gene_type:complete
MEITVRNCKRIKVKQIVDEKDGILSIVECMNEIPFKINRSFWISGFEYPKAKRGFHAHKKLEQAIFCISGSFKMMIDDGETKQHLILNNPNLGVYIGPQVWHTMFEFSTDCIIVVLASDYYCESDYIRNYNDFLHYVGRGKKI